MFRWWAFWRRVEYTIGFFVVVALFSTGLYYLHWYQAPTCFDGIQNSDEHGVDCGGSCTRICSFEITAPAVLWAESFKISDGQYNTVAYIENRNKSVGSPELRYTLKLYDDAGLITERQGTTVLPPDGVYPIFEGRIMAGERIPNKTTVEFASDAVWLPGEIGREQFSLERRDLVNADSKPRLTAQLRNTSLDEAQDVEIIATIFDSAGHPLTAARSVVQYFSGRSTQSVVFTWPEPIAKTLRSCEIPTDVVLAIDLSGSMNDDGGTPPEPVTAVLAAAESFVSRLKNNDQAGIVTYATEAIIEKALTHDTTSVSAMIPKLTISPKEERGSTNTGDALKRIREELSSSRHNQDARKIAILLTDGLATAPAKDPEKYAQDEAVSLKDTDIQLFTIGLGKKVNESFLRSIASSNAQYYNAPTTHELDLIYTAITKDICEDGPAVIEVIPKTKTNFAPLQ